MYRRLLLTALLILTSCQHATKSSIVMLMGNGSACTGFQVQAPSGKSYLITAGHCAALAVDGSIDVTTESGNHVKSRIIHADANSDLLLLEAVPGLVPFEVAKSDYAGERVRVMGHGYALPLWEVDGCIIGDLNMLLWTETLVSAIVAPGHSGSPALDPSGYVLGVVSTGTGTISGLVRLQDVQAFLKGY